MNIKKVLLMSLVVFCCASVVKAKTRGIEAKARRDLSSVYITNIKWSFLKGNAEALAEGTGLSISDKSVSFSGKVRLIINFRYHGKSQRVRSDLMTMADFFSKDSSVELWMVEIGRNSYGFDLSV